MFTGIITDVGHVRRLRPAARLEDGLEMTIATAYDAASIELGASIACSGVCLTVVSVEPGAFTVQASERPGVLDPWRLARRHAGQPRTRPAQSATNSAVTSSPAMSMARRKSSIAAPTASRCASPSLAEALAPFVASKGSVALDGVSLTVNEIERDRFGVNIIPYTLTHTSFGDAVPGQRDEPGNRPDRPLCRAARSNSLRECGNEPCASPTSLLVEAPYYAHIAALLRKGAERALDRRRRDLRRRLGPRRVRDSGGDRAAPPDATYDGYVALGCVIRGETSHYDHICAESARALQDIAVRDGLAIGYGILTVENEAQALARAAPEQGRDKGGEAVRACLAVIDMKRRFAGTEIVSAGAKSGEPADGGRAAAAAAASPDLPQCRRFISSR